MATSGGIAVRTGGSGMRAVGYTTTSADPVAAGRATGRIISARRFNGTDLGGQTNQNKTIQYPQRCPTG